MSATLESTVLHQLVPARVPGALHLVRRWLAWREPALAAHGDAVGRAVARLAPADRAEEWYWAGALHDLGKLAWSRALARNTDDLTPAEWTQVRRHPVVGARWLRWLGAPAVVVQGAYFHHARWNGTGYPHDLGAERIPVIGRALAIADVYVAMTEPRPYRAALPAATARAHLRDHAGALFDSRLVARFIGETRPDEDDYSTRG